MRRLIALTLTLLAIMPAAVFGQSTIRGIVIDSLTQEPMASATVYVNGTTQGTATDAKGRFELKEVTLPATVVFSFVGYKTQALELSRNPGALTIRLETNDELPEILVSGKTNKIDKKDLEEFKKNFLGDDRWGRNAVIKNEDVIMIENHFEISYDTRQIMKVAYTSQNNNHGKEERLSISDDTVEVVTKVLNAWAYEPLIIDLPLLGYEVYVDLIRFRVEQINSVTQYDMLGYFYYKPYSKVSKRQARTIEENRKKAYYGSSHHFLRSLAEDRLTENGYILSKFEEVKNGRKVLSEYKPLNISKHFFDHGGYNVQIRGLKDENLKIRYYYKNDGSPVDFSAKRKGIRRYSESKIKFLEDTCTFRKFGIVSDNNIRFIGELSKRRVASSLPGDYYPPSDSGRTMYVDYESELLKFADNINEFNSMFPQEKVYLEFDNTAYFQGENIWYKAFVTHATTLECAPSGVLYVDFLAPTGQLILQQKLKIDAGQADGAIPLIDAGTAQTREMIGIVAYPSGFYEIRAYTQNMLDFSPGAIFSRVIPVYTQPKYEGEYERSSVVSDQNNTYTEYLREKSKVKNKNVNVEFYPEGGDIILGLPCRVAFKATGSDAYGIDGKLYWGRTSTQMRGGVLRYINSRDSASTVHDGMGSFIIKPTGGETAQFVSSDGKATNVRLPEVMMSGYSMIADMLSDSSMEVNIWRTKDRIGEKTALAVICRGEVIHFEEIKDIDNSRFEIDCSDWPVGVCRVTLFNREGRVLSSRSIFHNSDEYISPTIELNTDSMSRQSCDKEVLELQLTDQEGNPFRDRFCLSVRDATDYGVGRTENLKTNLLLSSDLRGYIHDPAWYLDSNDEEHREALNLLTLVQGWERYEWQTMTGMETFNEKHRVEEGLSMNGWILSYSKREPVSDIGVYANVIPENDKTLFESFEYQTDSTGYFGFNISDFYGNAKFNINLMSKDKKGESKNEKSKRIRFERGQRPKPRPYYKQETDLNHNNHRLYDYKVDYTDFDLTPAQRRKLGNMIDDVDIEEEEQKRRFLDYDTFISFEAEEDAELELDYGEYTTDMMGYLLDKGIRYYELDLHQPFFYVHNKSELRVYKPFDNPFKIDMIDVKSVVVYEKPKYPYEIDELVPIMREWVKKRIGAMPPNTSVYVDSYWEWLITKAMEKYTLIDVQIKEDSELLFGWEIRNLGRRTTTMKGFTRPVRYYSPVYPDGPIEGHPDYRRTVYWNANVITDEDGRARVEFYNNSYSRKFTINAAGITASGIPYILNQNW